MRRTAGLLVFLLLVAGCAGTPKVKLSQLNISNLAESPDYGTDASASLLTLLKKMRGARFGDQLFKRSTSIYWIIPEIDKLDLDVTAQEEQFSANEYKKRLENLNELHNRYLIFSVDLRVPFNAKWPQTKLIKFLKTNLVISLENGTGKIYFPESTKFRVVERFKDEDVKAALMGYENDLEVRIPIRLLFSRGKDSERLITPSSKKIVIKLGLRESPPYNIGFFDEKFFQGYMWKIVRDN
jgi:hypothetical protein